MVNYGKPSKACLPCRKRKLPCNLNKPCCGQCSRAGLACSGYRDAHELMFLDQTPAILQKLSSLGNQLALPQVFRQATSYTASGSIITLPLALDVRARYSFFAYYVSQFSGSYKALTAMYDESKPGDHLATSVDAVSLAFMANNHSPARELSRLATQLYVTALRRVNEALKVPELAIADSTLQSVLLLDLYEKLANRNLLSASSWVAHMDGALMLARRRGIHSLQSYTGQRLANRLYITLLIICAASGLRVPAVPGFFKPPLSSFHDKNDIKGLLLTTLNVQTINFSVDIEKGKYSSDIEIVAEAKRLDALHNNLEMSMPLAWQAKRIESIDGSVDDRLIFGDHYDIYSHHIVTQVRNIIRTMRLNLHVIIMRFSLSNTTECYESSESSKFFIEFCTQEICASAPQYMVVSAQAGNSTPFTPVQVMQCYTLLPSLYLAGRMSGNPRLRTWIIYLMNYMAETGGVALAKTTADTLKFHPEICYWQVYAMLGGYAFVA